MLNELYELSRSLSRLGIEVVSWHRFLKECPRGTKSFFVDIDMNSSVTAVRPIVDPDRLSQLRKYEKAAGYSFPSFNILPLWRPNDNNALSEATILRKRISGKAPPSSGELFCNVQALVTNSINIWIDTDKKKGGRDAMDKVDGCLGAVVQDLTSVFKRFADGNGDAFNVLLDRVRNLNGQILHQQLSNWFVSQFESPSSDYLLWFDQLFSLSGKPKASSIVFELADQSAFEYPVNHRVTYEVVNRLLQSSDSQSQATETLLRPDAYGACDGGRDDSFPEVKMSRFGKINLRAMSRESLCQVRYHVAESKSFPVSQSIRQECKNALEWISRDERQGKTWCDVTSVAGASAVLFAYPSSLDSVEDLYAMMIGGGDGANSIQSEGTFEACASSITHAITGRRVTEQARDVIVFVLTKPDGFRTKVLYSNRVSEASLLQAAGDWERGCLNVPTIKSRQFGPEKGSKPEWRDPITPFTTEIIRCLNAVWIRGGNHAATCRTVQVADALSLLLDHGQSQHRIAAMLLGVLLRNSTVLILEIGQKSTKSQVHIVARNLQKHQLLLPRIIGLLLWKLDIKKGCYMKTPAFWIGRMLSLADQLHLQYCHHVRKGDIPPQLIGNSLMATALSTPEHALAILADRMRPYYAWAQTVQSGEGIGLVKYFLAQLRAVATDLAEQDIPKRASDSDRAIMLLGYLSRPEKETPNHGSGE